MELDASKTIKKLSMDETYSFALNGVKVKLGMGLDGCRAAHPNENKMTANKAMVLILKNFMVCLLYKLDFYGSRNIDIRVMDLFPNS
jgi:hypothetical protein